MIIEAVAIALCSFVIASIAEGARKPESPPRKRLPLPTREHEPRLLALVERVEAADRRVEGGCGLEQCSVHDVREAAYRVRHPKPPKMPTPSDGVDRNSI